jgi:hypothetical protein
MQPRTPRPYALAVPTDATSGEAASTVHREAHGLVADDVFRSSGRGVTVRIRAS